MILYLVASTEIMKVPERYRFRHALFSHFALAKRVFAWLEGRRNASGGSGGSERDPAVLRQRLSELAETLEHPTVEVGTHVALLCGACLRTFRYGREVPVTFPCVCGERALAPFDHKPKEKTK